jgi:hypothetical protein
MTKKMIGKQAIDALLEGKTLVFKKKKTFWQNKAVVNYWLDKEKVEIIEDYVEGFQYSTNNADPNDAFGIISNQSVSFFLKNEFEILSEEASK